ncbi:hypothetical protein MMC29_004516 [Sticta canariensis]|nr:hypothetical protein [Sticta canariensis]
MSSSSRPDTNDTAPRAKKAPSDPVYHPLAFGPILPVPIEDCVKRRIHALKLFLDPDSEYYQQEGQHPNIRAVLKMYENGELVDNRKGTWLMNGQVVTKEEATGGKSWAWVEVRSSKSCDEKAFD